MVEETRNMIRSIGGKWKKTRDSGKEIHSQGTIEIHS